MPEKVPISSIWRIRAVATGRDQHLVTGGRSLCWDVAFSQQEMIWDQIPTEFCSAHSTLGGAMW